MAANQTKKPTSSPRKRRPVVTEQYPWTTNPKVSLKDWKLEDLLGEFGLSSIEWTVFDAEVVESLRLS